MSWYPLCGWEHTEGSSEVSPCTAKETAWGQVPKHTGAWHSWHQVRPPVKTQMGNSARGSIHPQQRLPPCAGAPAEHSPEPHHPSLSQEGGGSRGQGCAKGTQAAAVPQRLRSHTSHLTAGSAPAAHPRQGTDAAGADTCHTESHGSHSHVGA